MVEKVRAITFPLLFLKNKNND